MKYINLLYIILFLVIVLFYNLGKILDTNSKAVKSDIIVYLGGGLSERIKKSIELYKKGYSLSKKIIYTGSEDYALTQIFGKQNEFKNKKMFFMNHGVENNNIIYLKAHNTIDEIKKVKKYMLLNNYKSVIFITDPPHTLRVKILTRYLYMYNKSNLQYIIVSSDVNWWDRNRYYKSKNGLSNALMEVIKIVYNILYRLLDKFNLVSLTKEYLGDFIHKMKQDMIELYDRALE